MFSLRRQWHRFQLARELLLAYERDERERIPWPELMRRIEAAGTVYRFHTSGGVSLWAEAARRQADEYPSDA